jgi:hypothetical protein
MGVQHNRSTVYSCGIHLLKGCKWLIFSECLANAIVSPTFLAQELTNCCFEQQGDVLKMNPNLEDFHDNFIDLLKEPARNKQTIFNEGRNKVKKTT